MNEKTRPVESPSAIRVIDLQPITPTNEALYEAGKALFLESITVGREFCKFMITTSTGAIPIYVALLKFVLPAHYTLSFLEQTTVVAAGIGYLLAATAFAVGYYPITGRFSLDVAEQIEARRRETIRRRTVWSIVGFASFSVGVILSLISMATVPHAQ